MFESVEQLEKEVQEFRKNILASSELIKSVEGLIAATKAQKESFSSETVELVTRMNAHAEAIQESYKAALSKMVSENSKLGGEISATGESLLRDMQDIPTEIDKRNATINADLQRYSEELRAQSNSLVIQLQDVTNVFSIKCAELLQSVEDKNNTHLGSVVGQMQAFQKEYIQKLGETEATIRNSEAELEGNYKDFLSKIESTNVDRIFKVCQDIKKSVNSKLLVLSAGVGASIILIIASFFVR
ncbi:MAG: hypothetical protein RR475_12320 [Clostridia bacterium]